MSAGKAGKDVTRTIIVGFALFASLFGAGSLVFPSALGFMAGREWTSALLGFLPVALFPVLAFLAVARAGGTEEGITSDMGKTFSILFTSVVMLCAGLLVALPKTAGVVHEIGVLTGVGPASQMLTSFAFFTFVFFLSSQKNPSTVVERIGKYLITVFMVVMGIVILKGVVSPLDMPVDTGIPRIFAFRSGFIEGYETMNVFGGLIFSGAVFAALSANRPDNSARIMTVLGCAAVAGVGLLFVYSGLIYLGATGSDLFNIGVSDSAILVALAGALFEGYGPLMLVCAAFFVCLATAVALTTGISRFFSRITKEKLPYDACVALICVLSLMISTLGVETTARYAAPILVLIYPAAIVLVMLNVLRCRIVNKGTFVGATWAALTVSLSEMIEPVGALDGVLPLAAHGLAWVAPSMICGVASTLLYALHKFVSVKPER